MEPTRIFRGRNAHHLYRPMLKALLEEGQEVTAKGRPTKELLNVVTVVERPWERVHIVPGRRANPWLAMSEMLWLLAGRNDVEPLRRYNRRIMDYSDDGETLYGAYGYRLRDQIPAVIERLRRDPSDRRAVLTIWRPDDLTAETKDPPCNDLVAFKLRDGKLHMTVFCRSNDIHWGLFAVNLYQFSFLQDYIAAALGVEMGSQVHISNSLHVYLDGPAAEITERMLRLWDEPLPEVPWGYPAFLPPVDAGAVPQMCSKALDGELEDVNAPTFLLFAQSFLQRYREEGPVRYSVAFPDWMMAAKEFRGRQPQLEKEPEDYPNDELMV